jgi:hypothetical protein
MKIFKRGSMMQEHRTKPKPSLAKGTTGRQMEKRARFYENVLNFEINEALM